MRERVLIAMHKVWMDRCREICGEVEFGGAASFQVEKHFIQFCRVEFDHEKVVGFFHSRQTNPGEYELIQELHYSPPRSQMCLRPVLRHLFAQAEDYHPPIHFVHKDTLLKESMAQT